MLPSICAKQQQLASFLLLSVLRALVPSSLVIKPQVCPVQDRYETSELETRPRLFKRGLETKRNLGYQNTTHPSRTTATRFQPDDAKVSFIAHDDFLPALAVTFFFSSRSRKWPRSHKAGSALSPAAPPSQHHSHAGKRTNNADPPEEGKKKNNNKRKPKRNR